MSIKKKLVRDLVSVGILRLSAIPLGLVTSIVLARVLGPSEFGKYAFIMSLIPLVLLPVSGGISQLLMREVAKFSQHGQWSLYKGALRASHGWVLITSALALTCYGVGLWADWLPTEGKWGLLPIAILMVPLLGLGEARIGAIKGLGMPALAELPQQFIMPLFLMLYSACAANFGLLSAKSAIWGQLIGASLAFFSAGIMFFKLKPSDIPVVEAEYQFGIWRAALLPFTLLTAVNIVNVQIGIIVLGFLSTDDQIAAMRVAERGGQFVALSLTLVNMVIAPYIVIAHQKSDSKLLQKLAVQSARAALLIALPIAAVFIFLGETIISLVFGSDYSETSYMPLVILTIGQLLNVFFGPVGQLLAMSGNEKDSLYGQMLALVANIVVSIALTPSFGAVGAALASALSTIIWNIVLAFMVKQRLKIKSAAF